MVIKKFFKKLDEVRCEDELLGLLEKGGAVTIKKFSKKLEEVRREDELLELKETFYKMQADGLVERFVDHEGEKWRLTEEGKAWAKMAGPIGA